MADLTVSDIARHIQRPGESLTAAVDRLRNWTDMGIIKAKGPKRPGTGHKRRYSTDALISAGILQTLVDATGSPAIAFTENMGGMVEGLLGLVKREDARTFLLLISRPPSGEPRFDFLPPEELAAQISKSPVDAHTVIRLRRVYERLMSEQKIFEAGYVQSKEMEKPKRRRVRSPGRAA